MKRYICLFFLILSFMVLPVSARAGGGSSGGSGGSGGSGHYYHRHTTGEASPLSFVFVIGVCGFFGAIKMKDVIEKRHQAKKDLKEACIDSFWDEKDLIEKVKDSYFVIQNAWSQQDLITLSYYLTDDLYKEWENKVTWQQFRNERNVLKNVRLLHKSIISVHDDFDNTKDYFWVMIMGKMTDQIVRNQKVESVEYGAFKEFWKFVRDGDRILLDEILQEDEADLIK